VTVLHMWMIAARMRAIEKGRVSVWQQHFIDHFFYDSEDKMMKRYGIKSAGQRGGYMKDLYHQYRGMTAAFDEGLMNGRCGPGDGHLEVGHSQVVMKLANEWEQKYL
jgi:cytochrome b pre-mRNA-processing protein 3